MKNSNTKRFSGLLACLLTASSALAMPSAAYAQSVADRTLSDIEVDRIGSCTTLTVNFNIRVQLLSHFPTESGRELHIRLQPLDPGALSGLRESLRPPSTVSALQTIDFEGDNPAGPVLSLFFTRNMHFDASPGRDPQSIVIRIAEPGAGGATLCASDAPAVGSAQPDTTGPDGQQLAIPEGLYVVNLSSLPEAPSGVPAQASDLLEGRIVYETLFERDSQEWHRLRAGFFTSRAEAEQALAALQPLFPDAFVVKVSPEERRQGVANRLAGAEPATATMGDTATPEQAAQAEQLVADAEAAIAAQEQNRAIQILTNALGLPQNPSTPRALELLGLMRERMGQEAQARAEYQEYLRRFPQGEAAERVEQRLAALSGDAASSGALRETTRGGGASDWAWNARGSFSQFYYRDESTTKFIDASRPELDPDVNNSVNLNQLLTSANLTVSGGNDRREVELRASGAYTSNFRTGGSDIKSLTALYLDFADNEWGTNLRVGRQTHNSAGVLGRFDGALASWMPRENVRLNLVGGFPVLRSRQMNLLTDRPFYGVSVDVGRRRSPFSGTVYWFDQRAKGGFIDRQSVGFETRVLLPRFNAFTIVDYDVKQSKLNLGLATLNFSFPDTSHISLTADYRQSPMLTTHNALIGQIYSDTMLPVESLEGLLPFFTEQEIYQLADDRTYVTKSVTVSYSRPIVDHLQANLDFTLTDTGGTPTTPASTGTMEVFGLPASGSEFYYGAQLIGTGLLWENDIYILSGRYSDTQRTSSYTADFNARIPLRSNFRLSPRLRYGMRDSKVTDSSYTQFQPSLRLNYYPMRNMELEFELGANMASQKDTLAGVITKTNENGLLFSIGYRLDF